jgi:hypothetical protein
LRPRANVAREGLVIRSPVFCSRICEQFFVVSVLLDLASQQIVRDEQNEHDDYFGPAGLKGRAKDGIETRDRAFRSFTGHIAVIKDYNPVKELETMNRKLLAIAAYGSEAEALNFIVKMTERERHVAVVILRDVEESIHKFRARLKDLASFYTRENAENFNAFFTHEFNNIYYTVEFANVGGQPRLTFKPGGSTYVDVENELFHRTWQGEHVPHNKRAPVQRIPDRLLMHLRRWRRMGSPICVRISRPCG